MITETKMFKGMLTISELTIQTGDRLFVLAKGKEKWIEIPGEYEYGKYINGERYVACRVPQNSTIGTVIVQMMHETGEGRKIPCKIVDRNGYTRVSRPMLVKEIINSPHGVSFSLDLEESCTCLTIEEQRFHGGEGMEINNVEVGRRIKNIRLENGLTLESFGHRLNTSKVTVFNWEKGRNLPNKGNLRRIADLSNMTVGEILYGSQHKKHLRGEEMNESKQPTHEELEEASKPLLDFLNKYYHPHAYVVVTEGRAEVFEGAMVTPLPVRD